MSILIPGLILGVCVALLELRTVYSVGFLRRFIQQRSMFGILMSLLMAGFLGSLFGAVGVTAMIGGVVAITITWPFYSIDRRRTQHQFSKEAA